MKKHMPLISLFGAVALFYFIIHLKYGLFSLPFFWDELGVYSRAAMHQAVHGLGLLPSSLPDVLSRGHPLLAPFLFGSAFKLFGISQITARVTGLIIYLIGIGFGYKILTRYIRVWWAVLSLFCVSIQPAFIAQSVLVLPETILMTLTLASIYFYLTKRHLGLWIAVSFAILTKESALILPIAFGLAQLQEKISWKIVLCTVFLPFAIFIAFLFIQHSQNGYYLYPLHQDLMDFNFYAILVKGIMALWFLFIAQGRWLLSLMIICIWIWKLFKKDGGYKTNSDFFRSIVWVTLGGLAFASINYYLDRYSIYVLFPLMLGIVVIMQNMNSWLKGLVFGISIALSILHLNNKHEFKDTDLAYITHVRSLEKGFAFIDSIPSDAKIGYNWPMVMANWSNNSGYDVPKHDIDQFNGRNMDQFDFVVISNPGHAQMKRHKPENLVKVKVVQHGYASVTIYRVIKSKDIEKPTSASDQ